MKPFKGHEYGRVMFRCYADAIVLNNQEHAAGVPGGHAQSNHLVGPAALITGIRSDLPGQITAQVTENIYDTPTGRARLIPQGARLIGVYDSQVAFGQSRVLLVWTRLIMPNGRSIVLERQQGRTPVSTSGAARTTAQPEQPPEYDEDGRPITPAGQRKKLPADWLID
jgi:hypothetical protein